MLRKPKLAKRAEQQGREGGGAVGEVSELVCRVVANYSVHTSSPVTLMLATTHTHTRTHYTQLTHPHYPFPVSFAFSIVATASLIDENEQSFYSASLCMQASN